jgi:G3E family GTPase
MEEMLGGCICCSIRGDLGATLSSLIHNEHPDVIVIEATGAANPMEILDAVTEASLYMKLEIKPVLTVVDSAHLLDLFDRQQGPTYRLMQEQIRCASVLIMNKMDLVPEGRQQELVALLNRSNPYASKLPAIKCEVDLPLVLSVEAAPAAETMEDGGGSEAQLHHSHSHVMVYTHYFGGPVDSVAFESLVKELSRDVYRGKGVLTFSDTRSRFLFQYAYRESDFMRIAPEGAFPDVVVFIGEHFDKEQLAARLQSLEAAFTKDTL